ncbi:YybH family protein [Nocardia arthritidis]|uniref:SgcJ/EcaC family oxidoreductase n=1 Tax=Nocardia arthritidis TaxID=228602 RepID=A0A6G9YKF3_9NOCA|nr:SgcJ/EcaC family oxidoreductase [Nocardia arthritidis]QIS13668.1 SgcJ/EcaC family oxidoreductase [Nocardia arthritidis]
MRGHHRMPIALFLAAAAAFGRTSRDSGAEPRSTAEQQVRAAMHRMMAALDSRDSAAFLAEFHPDADFHNPIGMVLHGIPEIRALHEKLFAPQPPPGFPSFADTTSTGSIQALRFAGPDVAVVDWRWTQRGARTGSTEWSDRAGTNTTVWTRENGRWGVFAWRDKDFPTGYQRPPGY